MFQNVRGAATIGADDLDITASPRPDVLRAISGLDPVEKGSHVLLVEWPTASIILHLGPLLALGVRSPSAYSFRFWQAYVRACRQLAERAAVDGRTLDQALRQWSKEQPERHY